MTLQPIESLFATYRGMRYRVCYKTPTGRVGITLNLGPGMLADHIVAPNDLRDISYTAYPVRAEGQLDPVMERILADVARRHGVTADTLANEKNCVILGAERREAAARMLEAGKHPRAVGEVFGRSMEWAAAIRDEWRDAA